MEATQMDQIHEDIVETIREPLLIMDQDLRVILASRSFYEFFKVTPEETVGQLVYDLGNKQWDIPKLRELLETLLPQKTSFDNYEVEHDFTDIGRRIMLLNARQIQRVLGKERIILLAIEDITERRQLEMLLADSEKRYRRLFETANDGILLLEKSEGNIAQANPAIMSMLGYSNSEFFGKKLKDVGFPDHMGTIQELLQALEQNGIIHYSGTPIQTKTGKVLYCDIYMVDKTDLVQCNIRDATKYRNLEIQLNQAQKMESVGRLAGGVAHDFNNMLGVILGHTELALLKMDEDNDLYSDLKEIQKAAKRSADITKQLLAFARKQIISPKQLDLNDTVENMLNMLRRLIGEDIDLVWQPAAHLWPVKMDPSQIDQILANLCINARDAIEGVGKLTIETGIKTFDEEYCKEHAGFIPGDFVLLAVSDNGCGMDKDTLNNLFEPFFTTKDVGKGTGLGLATVYGIVKQNNGFINIYSEPGHGSTFKIYLPRLVADEDTDKAAPGKKAAVGGTETILLVEDEPSVLRMTRMMLERKGYTILSAATPAEAMEKAKNHSSSIDLLMTDVVMPEMNGRDLAEEITGLYPGIRLLFMSGYTANAIVHQGVLDDGVAFIQKPFSMVDMTSKIRELLDMTPDKHQG